MKHLLEGDISSVVETYMGGPGGVSTYPRPQSWDFCFEYFSDPVRVERDKQTSCMQLGYYLASWGMLRGGSYLFKHTNARHYLSALDVIKEYEHEIRGVTPASFGERDTQKLLISLYNDLGNALLPEGGQRITLVTKTMMGVWGVFPSADTYFLRTFKAFATSMQKRVVFSRLSVGLIELIGEFYDVYRKEIEQLATSYQTIDFISHRSTGRSLPAAKIIDIYGFGASYYQ